MHQLITATTRNRASREQLINELDRDGTQDMVSAPQTMASPQDQQATGDRSVLQGEKTLTAHVTFPSS
ncbi:unnamed protein product [Caretta caretta]